MAREVTWGTAVSPTTVDQFFTVVNPKFENDIDPVPDDGFRGIASQDFALNQGFRYARFTFETQLLPQNSGTLFQALQGGVDAISGAGPYVHPIPQLNTGLPPSYSLWYYDATLATSRQMLGAYLEKLNLKYSSTGALKATVSFVGKYFSTGTKPTAVYEAAQPFIPWQNTATVNASALVGARLIDLDMSFDRKWSGYWGGGGTQDLTAASVGPIAATGTAVFASIDNTDIDLYHNNTQGQFQALFSQSASAKLQINMNTTAFEKGSVIDSSKPELMTSLKFRALYNSVDLGTLRPTITNNKSTIY
jgi:hypothetical protein